MYVFIIVTYDLICSFNIFTLVRETYISDDHSLYEVLVEKRKVSLYYLWFVVCQFLVRFSHTELFRISERKRSIKNILTMRIAVF